MFSHYFTVKDCENLHLVIMSCNQFHLPSHHSLNWKNWILARIIFCKYLIVSKDASALWLLKQALIHLVLDSLMASRNWLTCKNYIWMILSLNFCLQILDGNHFCLQINFISILWCCCSLSRLQIVELRENHLKALPKSMVRLVELRRLDIGQNDFLEFPEVVGSLPKLTELWCDCNRIISLPSVSL